jgi:hypothetical protein
MGTVYGVAEESPDKLPVAMGNKAGGFGRFSPVFAEIEAFEGISQYY